MTFQSAIKHLRDDPRAVLSAPCGLALGAFFAGYKTTDAGAAPILRALNDEFDGPSQANASSRAYLSSRTTEESLHALLAAVQRLLEQDQSYMPSPGPGAHESLVSYVRGPIEQGRPGLALGESTPTWLYDYSQGYQFGLEAVNPPLAKSHHRRFKAFEAWLQDEYKHALPPWYGILRVYEGVGPRFASRFIELWDEFESKFPT